MAHPARTGELVGQKLGKYELLALIAVGGTAEIYLARISGASGFEKYLVVKCLLDHLADDQEFVRMFLDEARVSAQLDHSNIVQTLELGEHEGRYFLVMEYLAGMSVAQLARKTQERHISGGLIDTNLVLGIAAQTCSGLQYAHSKMLQGKSLNLVHRDISPQNLVLGFEGILKIVDFGIAKSSLKEVHTRTGTIKGKFAYMSPEQCLAKEVDHRTDIFALGTLCHELLTGRRLFKRKTTYDTYQAIINGNIPAPSKVNPKLDKDVDEVILKALAYKADDRYQSSQEFGAALASLIHKRGGAAGPGDIARFYDENFTEDLNAHAAQMRELILGDKTKSTDGTWDSEIKEKATPPPTSKKRKGPTKPPPGKPLAAKQPPLTLDQPAPPGPTKRPPTASPVKRRPIPSILPKAPDLNVDANEDDEAPTRIEFNPADRVASMHSQVDDEWEAPTKHSTPTPVAPQGIGNQPLPLQPAAMPLQPAALPLQPLQPAVQQEALPPVPMQPVHQPQGNAGFSTPPATIDAAQPSGPVQVAPPVGRPTLMGHQVAYVNPGVQPQQPQQPQAMHPPGIAASDGVVYPQISGNFVRQVGRANKLPVAQPLKGTAAGKKTTPGWMHGVVFVAFVGLGFGVAAFIKMML